MGGNVRARRELRGSVVVRGGACSRRRRRRRRAQAASRIPFGLSRKPELAVVYVVDRLPAAELASALGAYGGAAAAPLAPLKVCRRRRRAVGLRLTPPPPALSRG
jgi:hypothetical protein